MNEEEGQFQIKCRYAVALLKLILRNKKVNRNLAPSSFPGIDDSYDKLSSSTGLRKATISDIINAKSEMKVYTLYRILYALGYTLAQFGKIFDAVTTDELNEYMKSLKNK